MAATRPCVRLRAGLSTAAAAKSAESAAASAAASTSAVSAAVARIGCGLVTGTEAVDSPAVSTEVPGASVCRWSNSRISGWASMPTAPAIART